MSTRTLAVTVTSLLIFAASSPLIAGQPEPISLIKIEPASGLAPSHDIDLVAAARQTDRAIALGTGKTTVVLRLSSTQTISALSLVNKGAKGRLTVFASSANVPTSSKRWQQIASDFLTDGTVKSVVRPNEARYLKVTFDATQPGEISRLGVYAATTVASKYAKDYALLAADSNSVESDGKSIADGKDLGEGKDIPSEGAEAPAEGPPPGLPAPPPFTFVPVLVPTSP